MERFTISMNSSDIDLFERKRTDLGMTKSAFIRLLLAEHDNNIPEFIKYKEIISALSDINTSIKELLLADSISDNDKLIVYEKINDTNTLVEKFLQQ